MGLTSTGYRRRSFEEILNAKIEKAKELFGEDINTDENTALGKYIRINAYDQYDVEEEVENVYYSAFPQYATGHSLDRLGWIVGITRNIATPARFSVKVIGKAGSTIEYGFLVGTETELNFYNTEETVIGEDGTCSIVVECVEGGTMGNVSPSDINQIVNPISEIDAIECLGLVEAGSDEESDTEFRKRYEIAKEGKGSCNEASIVSALVDVPTVNSAYVFANESATETVNGVPPKSIACFVDGGADYEQEIGEAIFEKKPIGVGTYGSQTVTVSYGALTDYVVNFSYAVYVDVYVKVSITTNEEFNENGNETIKANISAFIDALGFGKSLSTTSLYSKIYSVEGVTDAVVEVSTDNATYGAENIIVNPYENCKFKQIQINGAVI